MRVGFPVSKASVCESMLKGGIAIVFFTNKCWATMASLTTHVMTLDVSKKVSRGPCLYT